MLVNIWYFGCLTPSARLVEHTISIPQLAQTEAQVAAVWEDVMNPVRVQSRISGNTFISPSRPNVASGTFNNNMAIEEAIQVNVGTGNHVRGEGEGAAAVGKTVSRSSSWIVGNSSRSSLPTPLEVRPGLAAERALQVMRTYARRLRVAKNNETEVEE